MIEGIDSQSVYAITACALVAIGLHGLISRPEPLRKVLAINVTGVGVFLLLVVIAARDREAGTVDPVPHALVLTGIVVAVSLTALAVAIVRRLAAEGDGDESDDGESRAMPEEAQR
jgi:multicomponent Na+:H+ antiporter subunit C